VDSERNKEPTTPTQDASATQQQDTDAAPEDPETDLEAIQKNAEETQQKYNITVDTYDEWATSNQERTTAPAKAMRRHKRRRLQRRLDPRWGDKFFEPQESARCGKHALNNILGSPTFTNDDLHTACLQVVSETGMDEEEHENADGFYSHSVLCRALQNIVPPLFRLLLRQTTAAEVGALRENPSISGALVNQNDAHWTAVVKHNGFLWYVDSLKQPAIMEDMDYAAMLQRWPTSYLLVSHDFVE
jgi:hypothetical protein